MNSLTTILMAIALLASVSSEAQTLAITRGGSRPVQPAPAENFTGGVRVEALFEALDPSHVSGGSVTFEPGARTVWHSHPRGQILIVTADTGRVQRWGDPIEAIRQVDVVRIPAGQKHWHGASPQASMTHIAITEHSDGTRVQWMEQVSDEQYNGAQPIPEPSASQTPVATRPSGPVQQRDRPGTRGADRRRAVRRCVEAHGLVAARSEPGNYLGFDRNRKASAAWRPSGPRARQRGTAERGVRAARASGDLLRLA